MTLDICFWHLSLTFFTLLIKSLVFCSFFLVFLSMLYLQSNRYPFALQDTSNNMVLDLWCFGLELLTFSFKAFSDNIGGHHLFQRD